MYHNYVDPRRQPRLGQLAARVLQGVAPAAQSAAVLPTNRARRKNGFPKVKPLPINKLSSVQKTIMLSHKVPLYQPNHMES